jgi:hypothetical protein
MKRTVLIFGLISGCTLAGMMGISMPLLMNGMIDWSSGQLVGYTSMVVAFLAVFFGIRSYREKSGGSITFGKAFQVGILITLITSAIYVIGWEIVYWGFMPDFGDRYAAKTLENLHKDGASPERIAETEKKMASFKEWYRNPFLNAGITFLEIFPVGLIVTLVSAAILRKNAEQTLLPAHPTA